MKSVSIKPFNNKVFYENRIFKINNGHNIFFNFKKRVKKKGIEINTSDLYQEPEVFVYCDVPYPWSIKKWLKVLINRRKNILFCFESPIINPFNHFQINKLLFRKIYSWDDKRIDGKNYLKFWIPQLDEGRIMKKVSFKDKKFLTMVFAKKSSLFPLRLLSPYKTDLYKKRLEIINYFENKNFKNVHLYGWGWAKANPFKLFEKLFGFKRYGVYKGELDDKIQKISQYKFCFAVENAEAPGYITEKIFDCFKAGSVPIYYGAPNVGEHIPSNSYIDLRNYENYEDLLDYINSISENEYEKYQKAGKEFLDNKETRKTWFEGGFEKVFLDAVNKF